MKATFCVKKMAIFVLSLVIAANGFAESGCVAPVSELQSGVLEIDLGSTKIKLEQYNHIAKMKLTGDVNEDWTSVNTEDGSAAIIHGYLGNGTDALIISELIIKETPAGFEYAIFKVDNKISSATRRKGTAYIFSPGGTNAPRCVQTDYDKWDAGKEKIFGSISNTSSVNLERDGLSGM